MLHKIDTEIKKEMDLLNFFDKQWKMDDVYYFCAGKEGAETQAKAKNAVMAASQFDLGLSKYALDVVSKMFTSDPLNKISIIKELRSNTNWALKESKGIAEYLIAYELLTDPSRTVLNKLKNNYKMNQIEQ